MPMCDTHTRMTHLYNIFAILVHVMERTHTHTERERERERERESESDGQHE